MGRLLVNLLLILDSCLFLLNLLRSSASAKCYNTRMISLDYPTSSVLSVSYLVMVSLGQSVISLLSVLPKLGQGLGKAGHISGKRWIWHLKLGSGLCAFRQPRRSFFVVLCSLLRQKGFVKSMIACFRETPILFLRFFFLVVLVGRATSRVRIEYSYVPPTYVDVGRSGSCFRHLGKTTPLPSL